MATTGSGAAGSGQTGTGATGAGSSGTGATGVGATGSARTGPTGPGSARTGPTGPGSARTGPTGPGSGGRSSGGHGAERHLGGRAAWLRAAVLGANDGLISTASLVVGVASASNDRAAVLVAGIAGLTAGSLSMAAGEYVSVSSQRDTELADLARERAELVASPEAERDELARIYQGRGLSQALADQVADELSAGDDVERVHARDELGIDPDALANPVQASSVSAVSFGLGAVLPVVVAALVGSSARVAAVIVLTLVGLAALGLASARLGGAPVGRAVRRVLMGGLLALLVSLVIGRITGAAL
jgi:vacuolar iron transporter family protein